MTELYEHQKRFLKRNPTKCLLVWATGTGKTLTALKWGFKNGEKILIIVPKALKENWKRAIWETAVFTPYSERKVETPRVYLCTKEEFRRDWDTIEPCDALIIDEAHHFAGMKSQMSKNLAKYLKKHNPPRRLFLTATPQRSTPWDIYQLATHLGHFISYMKFRSTFFRDRFLGKRVIPEPKPGMEGVLANLVREMGDVVALEDCVDVPEQVDEVEYFKLTKQQEVGIAGILEPSPIVRYTKIHQIENGILKGDGYTEDQTFDSDKIDRIFDLAEEHEKLAVVCRYNAQIDMLHKRLYGKGKNIYVIRGDVKDRDGVTRAADADPHALVLIQADCSEGYELPSIGVIVFASMSFSYVNYTQMRGRFLRINKLKKNVFLHLLTQDGIDVAVYEAIKRKEDFNVELYERKET